ncbi:MAG: ParA family protein, partial [Methyloceanibacter sp.]
MQQADSEERIKNTRRLIAVANQKGGVGKTTTAINLGTAFAATDQRVLIIDLDPQGNASTGLGVERTRREFSSYDVLMNGLPLDQAIMATDIPGLDLVPSRMDLAGAEVELVEAARREHRLCVALQAASPYYDYIFVDCPPALGFLTVNALVAADSVLIPLQCEFFALEGLALLLRTVDQVRENFNPRLQIHGVVLTMFDKRNNLSSQVARDVRYHLG